MLLGLTFSGLASVALVASNVVVALIAAGQFFVYRRTEARRIQPVAIAHRHGQPTQQGRFLVYLTNDGTGAAFNVRFGILFRGVEYPNGADYLDGSSRGHRHRVAAGGRLPELSDTIGLIVEVPMLVYQGHEAEVAHALFFARYEDAVGKVWETRNPVDPLADFEIRAVRRPRLREWRERRLRHKALSAS